MLLLIKVEILATYALCLTLLDNLYNVIDQSQYTVVLWTFLLEFVLATVILQKFL